jgi:predicted acetyltransferase
LRLFFVSAQHRRQWLGRQAIEWLSTHRWQDAPHIHVEVLIGNEEAIAFWSAVGFADYCLTLEGQIEDS